MLNLENSILLNSGKALFISKASTNEANELISFLNAVGGESDFLTFGKDEFPLSVKEERQFISTCVKHDQCLMLVGKIDKKIVSQLYLDRSSNPRLSHIGDIALSVKKEYWGNGIGTHMISAAIAWATKHAITKLQLQVRTDHVTAIQLYKKFGFHIEGTLKQAIKINQVEYDNYLMSVILLDFGS